MVERMTLSLGPELVWFPSWVPVLFLPIHAERCFTSRVTHSGYLGVLPHIQMLLLPKKLTHALHSMGIRQWHTWNFSTVQIYPSGFRENEFSPLLACRGISCCRMAVAVSAPSHFSGIFFPWHQSKNHWQILKRQTNPFAHRKNVNK